MQKGSIFSLIIVILGLAFLAYLLIFPINIRKITSFSEISQLEINQKLSFSGSVISEKTFKTSKQIKLDNGIYFDTDLSTKSYLNKTISVLGIVDSFYENKTISVLRITSIKNDN